MYSRRKQYNLFICHAYRYTPEYERFVRMLKNARSFRFRNLSIPRYRQLVPATDRELLWTLDGQIRLATVVIVLSGMDVAYSKWIQAEIEISEQYGKSILGIHPRGSQRIPLAVQQAAHYEASWNTRSIIKGIRWLASS